MPLTNKKLSKKADQIRDEVLKVCLANKAGHIAPSLSCLDILVALYYNALSYKTNDPSWEKRDRLVFSKAHGCYSLYAILADLKILPKVYWKNFYTNKSPLKGCVERNPKVALEASCGALGHGLPLAVGMAFASKLQNKKYHNFCLIGDGEMQEGTTWEAIQFAVKHNLDNLTIIIDANGLQAMDFIVNVLDKTPQDKIKKLKGFGLSPVICPGHDAEQLANSIKTMKLSKTKLPKVLIAQTTKGFGLKCMENIPKFHFRIPTDDELCLGKSYEC